MEKLLYSFPEFAKLKGIPYYKLKAWAARGLNPMPVRRDNPNSHGRIVEAEFMEWFKEEH